MATAYRESLAVILAETTLRSYSKGARPAIETDHKAIRRVLTMAEATGKLVQWRLRILEIEIYIVQRAGIKYQAANALSRLKTRSENSTPLQDKVPVSNIFWRSFAHELLFVEPNSETTVEIKGRFFPLSLAFSVIAGIMDNEMAGTPMLSEFITVQSTNSGWHATFWSVGKTKKPVQRRQ